MNSQKRLPKAVSGQMIEFFRRQYVNGDGSKKELGNVAFPSEMRSTIDLGLASPTQFETPRVLGWYSLTTKGDEIMEAYLEAGLNDKSFHGYDINNGDLEHKIRSLTFEL